MNRYLLALLLCAFYLRGKAQELDLNQSGLNTQMSNYYQACLAIRQGVIDDDFTQFDIARDLLQDSKTPLTPLVLDTCMVADERSMEGHMYFTREYAAYLKSKSKEPYKDKGGLKGTDGKCMVMFSAFAPKGILSYYAECTGRVSLFVVAEVGGKVELRITRAQGEILLGKSYEDDAVSFLSFELDSEERVLLEIRNLTECEISFALATN